MRFRQVVEVALGLAPATLLLPFLLAGAFGTVIAAVAGGTINLATAGLIAWSLAGAAGIAALWVVVLRDGVPRFGRGARLMLAAGLLLGIAAGVRWLWCMRTNGHRTEASTWAVWLVLLGGPVVIAVLRLPQLWSSPQDGPA